MYMFAAFKIGIAQQNNCTHSTLTIVMAADLCRVAICAAVLAVQCNLACPAFWSIDMLLMLLKEA